MFEFHDIESALESAKATGLNVIRCNLTGKQIGTLEDSAILAAIRFEYFADPFANLEDILDSMHLRTLIQNSKPAPHLVSHKNKDGMNFLRSCYPRDLFALLASRMLFDNVIHKANEDSTHQREIRMQWLIECQAFFDENETIPGFDAQVDTLIRLDAIHDVRRVFYAPRIKELAAKLMNQEFNYSELVDFLVLTEDDAFHALTRMKNAPNGNGMSLSAALMAMTPEQLDLYDREEKLNDANRAKAIARIAAGSKRGGGTVTKKRIKLEEVALPKEIAEKYAAQGKLNLEQFKQAHKENKPASKRTKKASRFGDLSSLDFNL